LSFEGGKGDSALPSNLDLLGGNLGKLSRIGLLAISAGNEHAPEEQKEKRKAKRHWH